MNTVPVLSAVEIKAVIVTSEAVMTSTERVLSRTQTMKDRPLHRKWNADVRMKRLQRSGRLNTERRRRTWQRSESRWNERCSWGICLPAARRRCFSLTLKHWWVSADVSTKLLCCVSFCRCFCLCSSRLETSSRSASVQWCVCLLLRSWFRYINSDCCINRGVLQVQEDPTMSRKVAAIQWV